MVGWIVREPRERLEGRPGGPGDLETARGVRPGSFIHPWSSWPPFWLFPGLPDNPSNHLILQPVHKDPDLPRDAIGTIGPYKAGCKIRWFSGLSVSQGKSQKEGQEDLKISRGNPPSPFIHPWSSWPSFWLFPVLPDNPSNLIILQPVHKEHGFPRDPIGTKKVLIRQAVR